MSLSKKKRVSILWWPKDERAGKTKKSLGMKELRKPDPYHLSLPHVVTINGFQVLLTNVTCLPSYPIGRRYLSYSSLHPVYMPHPISKWPTRPLSHSLYPEYKCGWKTPAQCGFSLELACCSNRVSQSNKLYFPLILSHVWKFFSNPSANHNYPFSVYLGHPQTETLYLLNNSSPSLLHQPLVTSILLYLYDFAFSRYLVR